MASLLYLLRRRANHAVLLISEFRCPRVHVFVLFHFVIEPCKTWLALLPI